MNTFDSVTARFAGFNRQYSRYYSYRQFSYILCFLASILGYGGLHFHVHIAIVLCAPVYGGSGFLFVKARKQLNSILNDLLLEQSPIRISIQENIEYLQLKTTLLNKLDEATTRFF